MSDAEGERSLADCAATLTAAPWRLTAASIQQPRDLGLDDAGVLDVVTVASHQNTASRLRLTTGD